MADEKYENTFADAILVRLQAQLNHLIELRKNKKTTAAKLIKARIVRFAAGLEMFWLLLQVTAGTLNTYTLNFNDTPYLMIEVLQVCWVTNHY